MQVPNIDKKEALDKLRKAKGAHIKWRSYAQALVAGVTVSDDGVYDVIHTAHTYAVNDQGQILVTWAFGTEAEVIASDIELLLKET